MIEVRVAPARHAAEGADRVRRATPSALRTDAAKRVQAVQARAAEQQSLSLDVSALAGPRLTAFVEGLILGGYGYTAGKSTGGSSEPVVITLTGVTDPDAVELGRRNGQATAWARDLANTPSSVKNPEWLAAQARSLTRHGVDVTVHDEQWLKAHEFGGILAVGAGSISPPRLVEASWRPARAVRGVHVVLVGKGITFDTGGLNLKPGDSMKTMQTDMSGAAAVLAALRLIAQQQLPIRVTALVPSAENSFGANSYRPSDVVRHYGGRTSEIGNTDAEGRIVLADAMAYAAATLRPSVIVDIATLTGAMKMALGLKVGGLLATDDQLGRGLVAAGDVVDEPLWRLPLIEDYQPLLHSDVADATNSPGNPGGITAALFLRPFAGNVPWAHLDIAGPARSSKVDGWTPRGATGYGARLLAQWVSQMSD